MNLGGVRYAPCDRLPGVNLYRVPEPNLCARKHWLHLRFFLFGESLQYFIEKYATEFKLNCNGLGKTVLEILINYDWPGNIRQLENVVIQSLAKIKSNVNFKTGNILTGKDLPAFLKASKREKTVVNTVNGPGNQEVSAGKNFNKQMNDYAKKLIIWAMGKACGNKTREAKFLE